MNLPGLRIICLAGGLLASVTAAWAQTDTATESADATEGAGWTLQRAAGLAYLSARNAATTSAVLEAARFNDLLANDPDLDVALVAEEVARLRAALAEIPVAWYSGGEAPVSQANSDPVGLLLRDSRSALDSQALGTDRHLSAVLALYLEPGAENLRRSLAADVRQAVVDAAGWVWFDFLRHLDRRPELQPLANELLAGIVGERRAQSGGQDGSAADPATGSQAVSAQAAANDPSSPNPGAWLRSLGLDARRDLDVALIDARRDRLDEPLGLLATTMDALIKREFAEADPSLRAQAADQRARGFMRRFLRQPGQPPDIDDPTAAALFCAGTVAEFGPTKEIELLLCLDALDVLLGERPAGAEVTAAEELLATEVERLAVQRVEIMRRIDPRLARRLQALGESFGRQREGPDRPNALASANARIRLLADSLDGYEDQPFREAVENELAVCMRLGRRQGMGPPAPISDPQFSSCLSSFENWALAAAIRPEASGDAEGPFGINQLERELELPGWQRVNYIRGYLARLIPECSPPEGPVINPIEWSVGARSWLEFSRAWPLQALAVGTAPVRKMGVAGLDLIAELARPCQREDGLSRVLNLALENYRRALAEFAQALAARNDLFRQEQLASGADVVLTGAADQVSKYRPEEQAVGPCDVQPSCGVNAQLPASRALFGLFPNAYLLADQTRLGEISLCYANVRWVERRQSPPPTNDPRLALYHGRLSFELRGFYSHEGEQELVFARRLTSADEHEYLMGASDQAVLENDCPQNLVGTSVVSELPQGRFDLVPRRLTYLTALRTDPARLFATNWEAGEEWRDQFLAEDRVDVLVVPEYTPLLEDLAEHMGSLKARLDRQLYSAMLNDMGTVAAADRTLRDATRRLTIAKSLMARVMRIYLPLSVVRDEALRATLFGEGQLMDRSAIAIHRGTGGDPMDLPPMMRARMEDALESWLPHLSSLDGPQFDPVLVNTLVALKSYRLPRVESVTSGSPEAASR